MAGPVLVPNLVVLRNEFNQRWPRRDRRSDGWIGDRAHQSSPSGHNPDESGNAERRDADNKDEVRALDVDRDIDPAPADELYAELDRIRRTPALRRRLIYIIYRGRIASASNGWAWKPYTGSNPHDQHGHLSGHPDHDDNTAPWGITGGSDMFEADDRKTLRAVDMRLREFLALADVIPKDLSGQPFRLPAATLLKQVLQESTAARLREEAILAAVTKGQGADKILARINEVAAAEAARDEQAARERATLADLVEQGLSGELEAAEVVRLIGERLTAAPTGQR